MEPQGTSQTDIVNVRTPSPVTSDAGKYYSLIVLYPVLEQFHLEVQSKWKLTP